MEKLTLQKFESYFNKTRKIVTKNSFLKTHFEINKAISEILSLKRTKTFENSFEKVSYKITKNNNRKLNYYYIGIYKNKNDLYQFDFYSNCLLSKRDLQKKIHEYKTDYIETSFKSLLNNFENKIKRQLLTDNLFEFKVKPEIHDYFKKNKQKYKFKENYIGQIEVLKSVLSYRKENKHFNLRYLSNITKNHEKERLQDFIYNNFSPEIVKLNKTIFSTFKGYNNLKLKNKIDEVGISKVKDFYKKYPLLINLYLRTTENLPEKEKHIANNFYANYNKDLTFLENIKCYFKITDKDLLKIENMSWQKFTSLKNRPLLLLSFIRYDIDLTIVKTRKEMHSLYVYFNYFHNSPYFIFKEKPNYENIMKMHLKRSDFNLLTNNASFHFDDISKKIPVMAFKRDIRVEYESFENQLMKSRLSSLNLNPLKKEIYLNGTKYQTEKKEYGVSIKNMDSRLNISIDLLTKDELKLSIINSFNFSEKDKKRLLENIYNEFYRFHNKKFPISKTIDKRFFFDYLYEFDRNKKISMKKYYFCPKIIMDTKKKLSCYNPSGNNKKRLNLIDII